MTSSVPVFESSSDTGKINVIKSRLKQGKKTRYGNNEIFLHKSPSKRRFMNEIYSLLRRTDARGSADVIYCTWRMYTRVYRHFADRALLMMSQSSYAQNKPIYHQQFDTELTTKCLIDILIW